MRAFSNTAKECFFRLIRLGIGTEEYSDFPTLSNEYWREICEMGNVMSLSGVMMSGIEALPKEKMPGKALLLRLIDISLGTEKMNAVLDRKSADMYERYKEYGFSPLLLKGQGTATFYPKPERRMPGDVDLWLMGGKERITGFLKDRFGEIEMEGFHFTPESKEYEGVELHVIPCMMNSRKANRWLLRMLDEWKDEGLMVGLPNGAVSVCIPSDRMNRTYMMIHKYTHFKSGGIGLKQVLDYMMLLRKGFTEEERMQSVEDLKKVHMDRFCRAVMYVLKEVFGMEDRFLLMKPHRALGQALMKEIFTTGNFGFYDDRYVRVEGERPVASFSDKLKRKIMQIRMCPQEVFWGHMGRDVHNE